MPARVLGKARDLARGEAVGQRPLAADASARRDRRPPDAGPAGGPCGPRRRARRKPEGSTPPAPDDGRYRCSDAAVVVFLHDVGGPDLVVERERGHARLVSAFFRRPSRRLRQISSCRRLEGHSILVCIRIQYARARREVRTGRPEDEARSRCRRHVHRPFAARRENPAHLSGQDPFDAARPVDRRRRGRQAVCEKAGIKPGRSRADPARHDGRHQCGAGRQGRARRPPRRPRASNTRCISPSPGRPGRCSAGS